MTLRQAKVSDVAAVLPMVRKIVWFHESLDSLRYQSEGDAGEMYRRWLEARAVDERSVFLVAEAASPGAGDMLVGFLVGSVEREIPIYRLREYGLVHDLWVEEGYRNEGIGRQLMMLAVERFKLIGVPQVRLHAAAANAPAQALFKRCGFRAASVEMILSLEQP